MNVRRLDPTRLTVNREQPLLQLGYTLSNSTRYFNRDERSNLVGHTEP